MDQCHVAAAVVTDRAGRILLAKRPVTAHQGGLWEFPGGKLESGETVLAALARELDEELGIQIQHASPLIKIRHRYTDIKVLLEVFRVDQYAGRARGNEGQEIRWVEPADLHRFEFPEANLSIISAATLPAIWPILDQPPVDQELLATRFQYYLDQGYKALLVRSFHPADQNIVELLRVLCQKARCMGVKIVLNTNPDTAMRIQASGVHLNSRLLVRLQQRPLSQEYWVGASCHTLGELQHAQNLGLDYAFLSPVLPTTSHPGANALGWPDFQSLVDQVNIPVYALGGLGPADVELARGFGAQGVAGITGFLA